MNLIQQRGYGEEPTASIDADRAAVRQIEADFAAFLASAKAKIAAMECDETKRLLEDLDDYAASIRSDVTGPALLALDAAIDEKESGMTYADMRREWAPRVL